MHTQANPRHVLAGDTEGFRRLTGVASIKGFLPGAFKIRTTTYVSGNAPSKKSSDCDLAHARHSMQKLRRSHGREISGLPVPGVHNNPFIEVTPTGAQYRSGLGDAGGAVEIQ
jgi:hypothetical protein